MYLQHLLQYYHLHLYLGHSIQGPGLVVLVQGTGVLSAVECPGRWLQSFFGYH